MIATILLSLLNVGLLAIPIGGTAGVLAGIDYQRKASGQQPLFTGGGDDGGDGSSGNSSSGWDGDKPNSTTIIGGITINEYCQQYNTIEVNTTSGQNYTLNPNQWGYVDGEAGGLCLNVTTNNNETYATNTTAPKWSATWHYDQDSVDQPVHAYPNIQISNGLFPLTLADISQLQIKFSWTYSEGNTIVVPVSSNSSTSTSTAKVATATASTSTAEAAAADTTTSPAAAADTTTSAAAAADTTTSAAAAVTTTTAAAAADTTTTAATRATAARRAYGGTRTYSAARRAITDAEFNANVAIDMFFDSNATQSGETSDATYEVMVWFAQIGPYADPIGWSNGTVAWQVLEGVNFTLYYGVNDKDQHVLTWIAQDTTTTFDGDILPLITVLSTLNLAYAPTSTDYLGYFSFGSEAYYSNNKTVTFDVPELSIDIW